MPHHLNIKGKLTIPVKLNIINLNFYFKLQVAFLWIKYLKAVSGNTNNLK